MDGYEGQLHAERVKERNLLTRVTEDCGNCKGSLLVDESVAVKRQMNHESEVLSILV